MTLSEKELEGLKLFKVTVTGLKIGVDSHTRSQAIYVLARDFESASNRAKDRSGFDRYVQTQMIEFLDPFVVG